jgi:spermidine/putrescine ABC transporter ATP-binding subunit
MTTMEALAAGRGGANEIEPLVRLRGVTKRYGAVTAVEPITLDIEQGDFIALLGPSGCGKTTLLNMISGFLQPSAGTIEIGGADMSRVSPDKRRTNMVFQGYGLFPHMTVRQNIAYGLVLRKTPKAELDMRVEEAMALVHMDNFANRFPAELSGGQQQRVALARALIMRPQVLLLDEPLAALDLKLRKAMQAELRRIHQQIGGTFVFVTHDQEEAMGLANRIVVMERGRIVQEGTSEEIYRSPKTCFVAEFIGEANTLSGIRKDGTITLDVGATFKNAGPDGKVVIVVRPESLSVHLAGTTPAATTLTGIVQDDVFLGAHVRVLIDVKGQTVISQTPSTGEHRRMEPGSAVTVAWPDDAQCVLENTR